MIEIALAALLVIGAVGTGQAILHRLGTRFSCRTEEIVFSLAAGFGMLMLLVLALGLMHLLYVWAIYVVVALWAALGARELGPLLASVRQGAARFRWGMPPIHIWAVALAGIGMGLNLLRALAPPHGATDPLAYQMALPKIFLAKHYLSFEPTITGALFPINMGLLYVAGIGLRNGIVAQILHWLMGVLSCLAIFGFCRRYFSWETGAWAAAIFSYIPIIVIFGPSGYVDVGLCFFQFMAFWALFNWSEQTDRNMLVLAALLTGLAMGVKHQGLATLFLGMGIVAATGLVKKQGWVAVARNTSLYCILAFLLVVPWYVRSYALAGNPVWPLANGFFHGFQTNSPNVFVGSGGSAESVGGIMSFLPSWEWLQEHWRLMSPWDWTFNHSGWQKAIGIYFVALAPGLLIFTHTRKQRLLIAFCFLYYLVLILVLHKNPRYGLVLFAFLSVLCGHVAEQLYRSRTKLVPWIFGGAFAITASLNTVWAYALAEPFIPVATGRESRAAFLQKWEGNYRLFQFVNAQLSPSAKILFQGIVKGFYCERSYLWDHPYQAVLRYEDCASPEDLLKKLQELGVTHIARMIFIPPARTALGYPQYFTDPFHEAFRKKFLRLIYSDKSFVLFEVMY